MNTVVKTRESDMLINNNENIEYNENIDNIYNNRIINKKINYLNIYALFIIFLVLSNVVLSVFMFIYLQNINNEVSSVFLNTTLIEHVEKLEKMIDLICKNIIVGC